MGSNAFVVMLYERIKKEKKVIAKRHAQEINVRYVVVHGGSLFIQVPSHLYIFSLSLYHLLLNIEITILFNYQVEISECDVPSSFNISVISRIITKYISHLK